MQRKNQNSLFPHDFTKEQIAGLQAFADTLFTSLSKSKTEDLVKKYSTSPSHAEQIRRFCAVKANQVANRIMSLPEPDKAGLKEFLSVLNSTMGKFLMTFTTTDWQREKVIVRLQGSVFSSFRTAVRALNFLCCQVFFGAPYLLKDGKFRFGRNPAWGANGFPGLDPDRDTERFSKVKFTDYTKHMLNLNDFQNDVITGFDAVVVGSGCGGAVTAARLAKSGLRVLILEKGPYVSEAKLSGHSEEFYNSFIGNGNLTTENKRMAVFSGRGLGGGSFINWACCLDTPYHVREEWAKDHGLIQFLSKRYQQALRDVKKRLNVHPNDRKDLNVSNSILYDGCKNLGYPVSITPLNVKGPHKDGFCNLGCRYGEKQSMNRTYLEDAVHHGAKILTHCYAKRVIIKNREAKGLVAYYTPKSRSNFPVDKETNPKWNDYEQKKDLVRLTILAPVVVLAAGALSSPGILKRSSLMSWHIGANLYLHPVLPVVGIFPKPVKHWDGGILTTVCKENANWKGDHYGSVIEVPSARPELVLGSSSFTSAERMKELYFEEANVCMIFTLARDKIPGSLKFDKTYNKEFEYTLSYDISDHDVESLRRGIGTVCNIMVDQGVEKIIIEIDGIGDFEMTEEGKKLGIADPNYQEWIDKVQSAISSSVLTFSAHQMGTCRMSSTMYDGVVKPTGETWEIKNLFVNDGSVFPTSSGVNPMLTILSIAEMNSDHIVERALKLRKTDTKKAKL